MAALDSGRHFDYTGIMETKEATVALAALAHDTRLRVFRMLVRAGYDGMPAGEIATALEIPNPTLSFHLNHLSQAGLIASRRAGRSIIYSVSFEDVRALLTFLMEDCCQGKADLCGPLPQRRCCPSPDSENE